MRILAAALLLMLLALPAAARATPHNVLAAAVDDVIRPGFHALSDAAGELVVDAEQLCSYPSEPALADMQAGFRALVLAWSRVEFLRFGPLMEDNRSDRILFWPDRKGIALRQVQAILSDNDETATAVDDLRGKSVAVQGLGALEYVLFGTGFESLATVEADFRCRYAEAIAQALARAADELVAAWDDPDGIARRLGAPTAANADFRTATESMEALVGAMSHGIEAIRDTRLLPFLGRDGETPKPKSALFWRSNMTVPAIRANFAGIADLFARSQIVAATPPDSQWIGDSVAFEFGNVERAAGVVTAPVAAALYDPAQRQGLDYLIILSGSLQTLIGENLSQALGLSVGFSSLDGD